MAIKICHASIDENKKNSGGNIGDQTSKEVCVRSWYSKPWQYYIECTDTELANKAADLFTEICSSNLCGYDQSNRLSLYKALVKNKGKVKGMDKCETDCSAAISAVYKILGLNISPYCTTRNIRYALLATGKFKVYSDSAHIMSDKYAKRGGIYLKEGSHVVMAIENGSAYSSNNVSNTASSTYTKKQFVKDIQRVICAKVDGIASEETLSKTITVSKTKNNKHAIVKSIQKYLNSLGFDCGEVDGIAGLKFEVAVKAFQKANNCVTDGEITACKTTWKKLLGM